MATALEKALASLQHWREIRERILADKDHDPAMLARVERAMSAARIKVRAWQAKR